MKPPSEQYFLDRGCLPHQAAFAARFFAPDAPRAETLRARPGFGKSFTAAEIAGCALSRGLAATILVVAAGRAAAHDIADAMESRNDAVEVMRADRRRWWQLEANAAVGANPWPARGIVVVAAETLRHGDVAEGIRLAQWGMIVLRGIDRDGIDHVRGLLEAYPDARILRVLDGEPPSDPAGPGENRASAGKREEKSMVADLKQVFVDALLGGSFAGLSPGGNVLWDALRDNLPTKGWEDFGKSSPNRDPPPAIRWLTYERGDAERRVITELRGQLRSIRAAAATRSTAVAMARAASSSLYGLERMLLDLRGTRNRLAHGFEPGLQASPPPPPRVVRAVPALLALIERVPQEAKAAALGRFLAAPGKRRDGGTRAVVFARSAATVEYLCGVLEEAGLAVSGVTDRMPYREQARQAAGGQAAGAVIVSTPGAAVALPPASTLVLYDLPDSLTAWSSYVRSCRRADADAPPEVVSFEDTSGCLPHEAVEREAMQAGGSVPDESILAAL